MLRLGMPSTKPLASTALTVPFDKFWTWLHGHVNCIVRAGTPDAFLFDHDDFHWNLTSEDESTLVVQLVRGKELVGELVVFAQEIAYVQSEPGDSDEHVFECIVESPNAREAAYVFVMAHEFDDDVEQPTKDRRWTH